MAKLLGGLGLSGAAVFNPASFDGSSALKAAHDGVGFLNIGIESGLKAVGQVALVQYAVGNRKAIRHMFTGGGWRQVVAVAPLHFTASLLFGGVRSMDDDSLIPGLLGWTVFATALQTAAVRICIADNFGKQLLRKNDLFTQPLASLKAVPWMKHPIAVLAIASEPTVTAGVFLWQRVQASRTSGSPQQGVTGSARKWSTITIAQGLGAAAMVGMGRGAWYLHQPAQVAEAAAEAVVIPTLFALLWRALLFKATLFTFQMTTPISGFHCKLHGPIQKMIGADDEGGACGTVFCRSCRETKSLHGALQCQHCNVRDEIEACCDCLEAQPIRRIFTETSGAVCLRCLIPMTPTYRAKVDCSLCSATMKPDRHSEAALFCVDCRQRVCRKCIDGNTPS